MQKDHQQQEVRILDAKKFILENEKELYGKKYVFVPCTGSDQLIVILSTFKNKGRYMGLKMFTDVKKTNILFITDPDSSYYLDKDGGKTFTNYLSELTKDFNPNKVTIFGSSMSAYAALFHGVQLDFNIIAVNGQYGFDIIQKHGWDDLKNAINQIPKKPDLNFDFFKKYYKESIIYLIHGDDILDDENHKFFMKNITKDVKYLNCRISLNQHLYPFPQNSEIINKIHNTITYYRTQITNLPILASRNTAKIKSQNNTPNNTYLDTQTWIRSDVDVKHIALKSENVITSSVESYGGNLAYVQYDLPREMYEKVAGKKIEFSVDVAFEKGSIRLYLGYESKEDGHVLVNNTIPSDTDYYHATIDLQLPENLDFTKKHVVWGRILLLNDFVSKTVKMKNFNLQILDIN